MQTSKEIRECKECISCCIVSEVKEDSFFKPAGEKCKHCSKGCQIFDTNERPKICSSYKCAWLRDFGGEEDRPDKSGVLISISEFNGGTWIFVQELKENAVTTTGKEIILDIINKVDLPVIVSDYKTKTNC